MKDLLTHFWIGLILIDYFQFMQIRIYSPVKGTNLVTNLATHANTTIIDGDHTNNGT